MRIFLGLFVLLSLFLMAAFWHKGTTRRLQQQMEFEQGISVQATAGEDRWARLVLGRPSGAEPLAVPAHLAGQQPIAPAPDAPLPQPGPEPEPVPAATPDFAYIVQPGDVLGTICQKHYGTAKPRVIRAVAMYNDLADENGLRQGQKLALPAIEILFPDGL
ncbi:MAG: hypothetical protein R3F17_10225 [Planctomycetota bacterium]